MNSYILNVFFEKNEPIQENNKNLKITMKINKSSTLLDVLFVLNRKGLLGNERLFVKKNGKNLLITAKNINTKIKKFIINRKLNLYQFISYGLNRTNDIEKALNLLEIFNLNLGETVNLNDVDCINQGPFGAWIGFGGGPPFVEDWNDNHIKNLIWIKKDGVMRVYNYYALIKMWNNTDIKKLPIFEYLLPPLVLMKILLLIMKDDIKYKIFDLDLNESVDASHNPKITKNNFTGIKVKKIQ